MAISGKSAPPVFWRALAGALAGGIGGGLFLAYVLIWRSEGEGILAPAILLLQAGRAGVDLAFVLLFAFLVGAPITVSAVVTLVVVFPLSLLVRSKLGSGVTTVLVSAIVGTLAADWFPLNRETPPLGLYRAWWGTVWFAIMAFLFWLTAARNWAIPSTPPRDKLLQQP